MGQLHSTEQGLLIGITGPRIPTYISYLSLISELSFTPKIDLARVTSCQDRLERQLEVLQAHQREVDEALRIMESVAEQLSRYVFPFDGLK